MKNQIILLFLFLLLIQVKSVAQEATFLSGAEFEDISYNTYEIKNYPKEKLPEGADKIYIRITEDVQEAELILKYGYDYKLMPQVKAPFPFNSVKSFEPEYKDGLIYVSSQMPYSSNIITGIFKIEDGDKLSFVKTESDN